MNRLPDIADIIVVGAGGAGLAAAVSAAEAGEKNIVVLESAKTTGGNSAFPHGIFGVETDLQKRLGCSVSRELVYKKAMEYAHQKLNGRLVKKLIDTSEDTIGWLEGKGIKFNTLIPHCPDAEFNTYHAVSGPESAGALIIRALLAECTGHGVRVFSQTRAKELLKDGQGRIAGVSVSCGNEETVIRSRVVILATGGFTGNVELLKKYDPLYVEGEAIHKGVLHRGDGFLMALKAGAVTDGQVVHEMSGPVFRESMCLTVAGIRPNAVWVNINGERYTPEDIISPMEAGNALYRQPRKLGYSLLDSKSMRGILNDELSPLERMRVGNKDFRCSLMADIEKYVREGKLMVSRSWEEIAAWMGVIPSALGHTISEYNQSCMRGCDEALGKSNRYLEALTEPPFYAIPGRVSIIVTHGGIVVNSRAEVLDRDGRPIPGLYAAGDDVAGTIANTYNIFLAGHSFGFAVGAGRIAGEEAAGYCRYGAG